MAKIYYASEALKDLKRLDKSAREQVVKKIASLQANPELGKPLRNVFKSKRSLHVGKYRVLYSLMKNSQEIIIAAVKHRKKAYRE